MAPENLYQKSGGLILHMLAGIRMENLTLSAFLLQFQWVVKDS